MKIKLLIRITLLVFLVGCSPPDIKEDLPHVVATINEKCPKMIDSETRIDGIELKGSDTLVYKYTLVNFSAEKIDTVGFRRAMWPGLISNIRISAEMKKLREAQVFFKYVYLDKNAKLIQIFKMTPTDYR